MKNVTYYAPVVEPTHTTVVKITVEEDVGHRKARRLIRRWARINHSIVLPSRIAKAIVSQGRKLAKTLNN